MRPVTNSSFNEDGAIPLLQEKSWSGAADTDKQIFTCYLDTHEGRLMWDTAADHAMQGSKSEQAALNMEVSDGLAVPERYLAELHRIAKSLGLWQLRANCWRHCRQTILRACMDVTYF